MAVSVPSTDSSGKQGTLPEAPAPDGRPSLEGLKITLVDDEPGVLRALSMVLQAYHGTISAYSCPAEALSALEIESADIVVSDLRMPGLSGIDFLVTLRNMGCTTPFILMSGHATASDVEEADAAGVDGYVPKPFTPPQLIAEILRVATNRGLLQRHPLPAR